MMFLGHGVNLKVLQRNYLQPKNYEYLQIQPHRKTFFFVYSVFVCSVLIC